MSAAEGVSAGRPHVGFIDVRRGDSWPPATRPGIRRYLTALAADGPSSLAANAVGVEARVLRVGDEVLPILVSDGRPGKASMLSPFAHHLSYPVEEIGRRSKLLGALTAALIGPPAVLLRAGLIDRAVFVNHWLLSGPPAPTVPNGSWPAIVRFVSERFPRHAVIVQGVVPDLETDLHLALSAAGGTAIPTRRVHVIHPRQDWSGRRNGTVRYNRAVARKLAVAITADEIPNEEVGDQCGRLAELYRFRNVERHSRLNPGYRPGFFSLVLRCEEFQLQAWRLPGAGSNEVAAFNLQRHDHRSIHWSTFGSIRSAHRLPAKRGGSFYQYAIAADIASAEASGCLLNWGAGAGEFKRLRGSTVHTQVEFVFTGHLPWFRRFAWRTLALARSMWLRRQLRRAAAPRGRDARSKEGAGGANRVGEEGPASVRTLDP